MSLRGYDEWKLPRERSGVFEVVCKHKPASCHDCGLIVSEPIVISRVVHDVAQRYGFRYSCRVGVRSAVFDLGLPKDEHVIAWSAVHCPRCGSEQYGVDECGERWESAGNWQEGCGVELTQQDECPRCDGAENLEVEDAE